MPWSISVRPHRKYLPFCAVLQSCKISKYRNGPCLALSFGYPNSASFGGFIGYNYEWEDVIGLGIELQSLSFAIDIN